MFQVVHYLMTPFRVLYKIYYFLLFSISLTLLFPLFYYHLKFHVDFSKAFVWMRFWAKLLQVFSFVKMNVYGLENIPKNGSYIICPNHSSFMDIPMLYVLFKRYFVFMGKKEIEKWPLFHLFYTSGMNILVDRKNPQGAFKAFRRAASEIDVGHPLVMFPEGTISRVVPTLSPFKNGAFDLAIRKQIPILPISFVSNWQRLQRSGFFVGKASPGFSSVIIHPPVSTVGLTKEGVGLLKEKVFFIIEEPLEK